MSRRHFKVQRASFAAERQKNEALAAALQRAMERGGGQVNDVVPQLSSDNVSSSSPAPNPFGGDRSPPPALKNFTAFQSEATSAVGQRNVAGPARSERSVSVFCGVDDEAEKNTSPMMASPNLLQRRRSSIAAAAKAKTEAEFREHIRSVVEDITNAITEADQEAYRHLFLREEVDAVVYCPVDRLPLPKGLLRGLARWKGPMHCQSNNVYDWFDPRMFGVMSIVSVSTRRRFANPFVYAYLFEPWLERYARFAKDTAAMVMTSHGVSSTANSNPTDTFNEADGGSKEGSTQQSCPVLFRWYYEKSRSWDAEDNVEELYGDPASCRPLPPGPSSSSADWEPFSEDHCAFLTQCWIEGSVAPTALPNSSSSRDADAPTFQRGFDYSPIRKGRPSQLRLSVDFNTWRVGFAESPRDDPTTTSTIYRRTSSIVASVRAVSLSSSSTAFDPDRRTNPSGAEEPLRIREGHRICAHMTYLWEYQNQTQTAWLPFPLDEQQRLTQWLDKVKSDDRALVAAMSAAMAANTSASGGPSSPSASQRAKSIASSSENLKRKHHLQSAAADQCEPSVYETALHDLQLPGLHKFREHCLHLSDQNRSMAMTSWDQHRHVTLPIRYHVVFINKQYSIEGLRVAEEWVPAPTLRRRYLEARHSSEAAAASTRSPTFASYAAQCTAGGVEASASFIVAPHSPLGNASGSSFVSPLQMDPFQRDRPTTVTLERLLEENASVHLCLTNRHESSFDDAPLLLLSGRSERVPSPEKISFAMDSNKSSRLNNLNPHSTSIVVQQRRTLAGTPGGQPLFQTLRSLQRDPRAMVQAAEPCIRSTFTELQRAESVRILTTRAEASDETERRVAPPPAKYQPPVDVVASSSEFVAECGVVHRGFQGKSIPVRGRQRGGGLPLCKVPHKQSLAIKGKAGLEAAALQASLPRVAEEANSERSQVPQILSSSKEALSGEGLSSEQQFIFSVPTGTPHEPKTSPPVSRLGSAADRRHLRGSSAASRTSAAGSTTRPSSSNAATRPPSAASLFQSVLPPCVKLARSCGLDNAAAQGIRPETIRSLSAPVE